MPTEVVLRLPPSPEPVVARDAARLSAAVAEALRVEPRRISTVRARRISFDARRRHRDWRVVVDVWLDDEEVPPGPVTEPPTFAPAAADAPHVVVVGSGPAGLFCALDLVAAGVRVTLLERGGDVRARRRPIAQLNRGLEVDPECNYCFGEGGAGTFSDGKLYTRSGNKRDVRAVLETLVAHGATPEILASWRPHVGSNRLPEVVQSLRDTLLRSGAEVLFDTRVDAIVTAPTDAGERRVRGVRATRRGGGGELRLDADAVVLATGHSALDALEMAARAGARLEPKGFALGVRAEHAQEFVDQRQYGGLRDTSALPAAFYELTHQAAGRGVYSFCMCPGGFIVPATTAADRVVVNGMSLSRRDSPFANSGIVVALEPRDWCGADAEESGIAALWRDELGGEPPRTPADDPLAGVRLQHALERRAARVAGGSGRAPSQRIDEFLAGRGAHAEPLPTSYRPGGTPTDLRTLFPRGISERLAEGLAAFDGRIDGFASERGQLLGVETRTSSPVRIARDRERFSAEGVAGLYPAGEGAGFAGGIVSAAIDGRRVAAALARALA